MKPPLDRSGGGRKGVVGERGAETVVWRGGCGDSGRKNYPVQRRLQSPPANSNFLAVSPKPEQQRERKLFWWEVLETSENADLPAIKKAYRTMIQKYHPDRVSHLGEEFQAIAEEKTKAINGAFEEVKKRSSHH
jgi:hypothetical protein